jgi:DNA-binding response OmpR family regulator
MNILSEAPGGKAASTTPTPGQTNPSSRILLVEDDPDVRQLSVEALLGSGYQVDAAEDGAAAWDAVMAISSEPDGYDLLITDNDMPKLSGLELIKRLRSARMTLPVILASGSVAIHGPRNCWLELAASLQKPFSTDELLETVQAVLRTVNNPVGRMEAWSPRPTDGPVPRHAGATMEPQ